MPNETGPLRDFRMNEPLEPGLRMPLFALGTNVFPGESLPLHIFEERYKAMIEYCLEGYREKKLRPFGISLANDEELKEIGCAVLIERVVQKYEDGRLDIITNGRERYRIRRIIREKVYPEVEVDFFGDREERSKDETADVAITLFMKMFELAKGEPPKGNLQRTGRLSFELAHSSGLDMGERQVLLEMDSEEERLQHLIKYYRGIIPMLTWREDVKERVRANGYFRKLPSKQV